MLVDHFPEATSIRESGYAFKHYLRSTDGRWSVAHIGMTRHPTHVGSTPEDVIGLDIKCPFHGEHRMQRVTRR